MKPTETDLLMFDFMKKFDEFYIFLKMSKFKELTSQTERESVLALGEELYEMTILICKRCIDEQDFKRLNAMLGCQKYLGCALFVFKKDMIFA